MYHHMEFDPYLIRECNQQIFKDVQALRLEKRLRKNHKVSSLRLVTFASRTLSICFAGWGSQDGSSGRDLKGQHRAEAVGISGYRSGRQPKASQR